MVKHGLLAMLILLGMASVAQAEAPWAAGKSRGEDLRISLVTFAPGDEIVSFFGHTALMVEDARLGEGRIYNYGMFDFGPDMLAKFVAGRLEFWVDDQSVSGTMRMYRYLDRDIRVQVLNLSPQKRLETAEVLAWNIKPENRMYLYHHYYDNCATRLRDIIDRAVDGQFKQAMSGPARGTLRFHTRRHSQHNPVVDFVLMLWENDEIDQPIKIWDEMFLPAELELRVDEMTYVNEAGQRVPLVAQRKTLYQSKARQPVPAKESAAWPLWLGVGLSLGAMALGVGLWAQRNPARVRVWGALNALVGLVFGPFGLSMVLFYLTEHQVAHWNENVLLISPFTLAALPFGLRILWKGSASTLSQRALRTCWLVLAATTCLALASKALPMFDQDTSLALVLFVPVNLLFAGGALLVSPVRQRALDLEHRTA